MCHSSSMAIGASIVRPRSIPMNGILLCSNPLKMCGLPLPLPLPLPFATPNGQISLSVKIAVRPGLARRLRLLQPVSKTKLLRDEGRAPENRHEISGVAVFARGQQAILVLISEFRDPAAHDAKQAFSSRIEDTGA